MKATIVPAQVTTVEDRIMGGLSFSQLMLLLVPVFVGGGLFIMLPPFMDGHAYKYVIIGLVTLFCITLAVRIKGKIIAAWLAIILRYNLRPKYYLFNKNTTSLREEYPEPKPKPITEARQTNLKERVSLPQLEFHEMSDLMAKLEHPAAKLRFETTRKGGLYVRLTKIED